MFFGHRIFPLALILFLLISFTAQVISSQSDSRIAVKFW